MNSEAVRWTYALAPDASVERGKGGAFLCTATSRTWIETSAGEQKVLQLLAAGGDSEAGLCDSLRTSKREHDVGSTCAAVLHRLDQLGLLARGLHSGGRHLASCLPMRLPPDAMPESLPHGSLRLSPRAFVRTEDSGVTLELPGAWARVTLHDRDLLPLLHDLAVGRSAAESAAATSPHPEEATAAVLVLMRWCGLLDADDSDGWTGHDLHFHARTRRGYRRTPLGKTPPTGIRSAEPSPNSSAGDTRRVALELPDLRRLLTEDPPFALVSERRHSVRRYGSEALTAGQLSEFLFRTLHERGERRPYPSAGACYPLRGYLAVNRCSGVRPGLYRYDEARHELIPASDAGPRLDRLLDDAAAAAGVDERPQVLVVLAARYARTQRIYGDLSYSLILKETGAVLHAAALSAAVMGLGACPLGCGNSLLFSELAGTDPRVEPSVGEFMLGTLAEDRGKA